MKNMKQIELSDRELNFLYRHTCCDVIKCQENIDDLTNTELSEFAGDIENAENMKLCMIKMMQDSKQALESLKDKIAAALNIE